ncbi:MAG: helix-turn-helix transcriptional regulator [Propionibacteriaceae bacterium]|nr:helix-turn-helix transcriptional regulator [Propionibacteriaceae bacterium]
MLNEARAARHLSVRGAAKLADVPPATMQGWLNGRHFPTPALRPKFQAFVEYLGLPVELTTKWWMAAPDRSDH